jgi:hypothetical protein
MPFITTLGSVSAFGFGVTSATGGTGGEATSNYAYFYCPPSNADPAGDFVWETAGNWYTDSNHTISRGFPQAGDYAEILVELCGVDFSGYVDNNPAPYTYHNWTTLEYWAPPAAIESELEGVIIFVCGNFYNAPDPIPVFNGSNVTFNQGDIVEYPADSAIYYEFKRPSATNTQLVGGVPDPYYWGYVGDQPYLADELIINAPNTEILLQGVNNGTPA